MLSRRRLRWLSVIIISVGFVCFLLNCLSADEHNSYGTGETLTEGEIALILNIHNRLRGLENSSNMNFLKWNQEVANLASEWAKRCTYEPGSHDDHHHDNVTEFHGNIGHIVHSLKDRYLLADAIREWYEQKEHFHYDSNTCDINYSCGKYTQVVWATTQYVGCGLAFCKTLKDYQGHELNNTFSFICNYAPSGNMAHKKPFKKGSPCSHCSTGILTCLQGLCKEDCEKDECTCAAECDNCGRLDLPSCRCTCQQGWMGPECSEPCRDKDPSCGSIPGWPAYTCKYVDHHEWDFVHYDCPAMCEMCSISVRLPKCEMKDCDPLNCHNGATFDKESCQCICPQEYTGEYCRLLVSEHMVGVTLQIKAPIHEWTGIWRSMLPLLARSINAFCSAGSNYEMCCASPEPTAQARARDGGQYVTEFNIVYGTDYPVLNPGDRELFLLLVYAVYWPDNNICLTQTNMEMVPQKVIWNAFQVAKPEIVRAIQMKSEEYAIFDISIGQALQVIQLSRSATVHRGRYRYVSLLFGGLACLAFVIRKLY